MVDANENVTQDETRKKGQVAATIKENGRLASYILPDDETLDQVTKPRNAAMQLDRFGTGGHHVGADMTNKTGMRQNSLISAGPNPENNRIFIANQFQRMLGFGKATKEHEGRPAFWSHFTKPDGSPIEKVEDLEGQTFKVCFAEKGQFPDKLKNNPSIDGTDDAWRGKKPEDAAVSLHPRLKDLATEYLKQFGDFTGINVEVVDSPDDANLTVMSWEMPKTERPRLLGFASFPEAMNDWARLDGLGQKRGSSFMFLNNNYCDPEVSPDTTDQEVANLFKHEFGHVMGWCHPHDLGQMEFPQAEALGVTLMAYSDMHPDDFPGKQGANMGAVDYNFANWFPKPSELNKEKGGVYDLQAQLDAGYEKNRYTGAFRKSGFLAMNVIYDHGNGTELHGTQGDDLIDTNPGYASLITKTDATGKVIAKQKTYLAEGEIAVVKGIAGNNTIIASEYGDQVIEPGPGRNEIKFYGQTIGGMKEIVSEGQDTLVLSDSLFLKNPDIQVTKEKGKTVISDNTGKIVLGGKGIAAIKVIDAQGKEVQSQIATLTTAQVKGSIEQGAAYARSQRGNLTHAEAPQDNSRSFTARLANEAPARQAGRG